MREILFRGKRRDDGQWVYGYLVKFPSPIQVGDSSPWDIIVPPVDPDDSGGRYNVDPDTVGQYTGLTDKSGKKIFEGDVVRLPAIYGSGFATVEFCGTAFKAIGESFAYRISGNVEIVGNIHDSPGLLSERSST